jgi:hypothetical protein
MNRKLWVGMVVGGLIGFALASVVRMPVASAQKARVGPEWEYKVGWFSYNPGERMNDARRVEVFERELNERAREGWEPAGVLMNRTVVQTVGGAVTTRDTVSFVAMRRPRR